nr:MAG TPA: helix-turn-helix domain protein [Caudoviricetes sp.]
MEQNAQQPFAPNDQSVGEIMSWQDSDAVRKLFVGNSAAKSVLRCLADFKNEKTGKCNPSTDTIAKETELNRKTVYKAITYLEEKGFIRRERVVLNSSNNYVLNLISRPDSSKSGSTVFGSTKCGTSPENGLSVVPNTGRVVGPNTGHEPVNEQVIETINTSNDVYVRRADSGSPDAQKNVVSESEKFNLTAPKEELTPEQRSVQIGSRCPHEKIIALYHECLPMLPTVRIWSEDRRKTLAARWRTLVNDKGYQTEEEGLGWFKRLFGYIRRSQFLTGETPQKEGHTWRPDLEWIIKPKNLTKIIEGKYHVQ